MLLLLTVLLDQGKRGCCGDAHNIRVRPQCRQLLLQSFFNRRNQHLPAILRTPDHLRVAGREHVPVALVGRLIPVYGIALSTSRPFVLVVLLLPSPIRNAPFIPMAEAQGLSGPGMGKR